MEVSICHGLRCFDLNVPLSSGAMHVRFMYNAAIGTPLPPPFYHYLCFLLYVIAIRHRFPFSILRQYSAT